ncbi:Fibronectin-binding protein A N-terminus (FbpA) [Fragilaria crotonensis]|nr:Fibronectin-binding protein A N-terminus (FbpA) [Fragilaria crotonensis]
MRQVLFTTILFLYSSLIGLTRAFAGRNLRSSDLRTGTRASSFLRVRYNRPGDGLVAPCWTWQSRLKSSEVESTSEYVYSTDEDSSWESDDGEDFDIDGETSDSFDDEYEESDQGEESEEGEDGNELIEEYYACSKALEKALNGLQRKQISLNSELKRAEDVEETVTRAQLIVSNLYLFTNPSIKTVTIQDWNNDGKEVELTLDSHYDSALAEADSLFAQARKLKRGSQVINSLLEETNGLLQLLRDADIDLKGCCNGDIVDEAKFQIVKSRLERSSGKTKFTIPSVVSTPAKDGKKSIARKQQRRSVVESSVRRLKSPGGCVVLVGRNRRGNEYLSFQVARGNDIWMHARGCPGAHVVLQRRRGSPEPTQECLEFCANLAVFYSDARNERKASVTAADSKHLLKPRGAPLGAVKLREELYVLTGWPEKVPTDLKLARDECGQTDEFRAQDKAKRRKRTQAVARQVQAKRREQKSNKRKARGQEPSRASDPSVAFDPY